VVVANGDGTSRVTCPGGDGGLVSIIVKNALLNYTSLSAAEKAELDLSLAVSAVSFPAGGQPVVSFKVSDSKGDAVTGLPPGDLRFGLLKLVPAAKGGNDNWVSYIAANATSTAGTETAATAAAAAAAVPVVNGVLTDNGDGSYAYTFLHNVLDPLKSGTTYDGNAVHRLAIIVSESGNPFAPLNVVRDFIPATGVDVTGQNDKVDGTACLDCHGSFRAKAGGTGAFHGGARYDVNLCVACHNDQRRFTARPGTGTTPAVDLDATDVIDPATYAWTGNAVLVNGQAFIDMPVFIHKLHMGEELTLRGGSYAGIRTPYEITYPQDVRNCDKCHRAPAAQAATFKTKPSMRACGSCHDGTSFLATAPAGRVLHSGGPQADDSACAMCHPASGAKSKIGVGVVDSHLAVADLDPAATWLGGTNANTNAAYLPAAGFVPTGAVQIAYDVKSVTRDASKHPSIVFRFLKYTKTPKDGTPLPFKDYVAGVTTELLDGFANSPSVYFAFAVPQDGIAAPADFNATASGYIKNIWNGTATGAGAGTLTYDPATTYYTITLTGVTIPDTATMLIGGVGYSYSLTSTPPLVQIDLPAYPYGDSTVFPKCIAGKMCGGLIVPAQDVAVVATDAASGKKYSARRDIVDTKNCLACHEQLGANPTFHAGQRNDGATCSFCHRPNQTSGGWSASSSTFVHGIHGASIRGVGFNWHAGCPTGTTFAAGTCTKDNAAPYYAKVTYPGTLNNCLQCHKPGTFDFSATASAAALPNLLMSTVGVGVYAADISTSPYVTVAPTGTPAVDYGTNFATGNLTSGTKDGVACTTAAPCVCSLAAPCNASATTLVESPITAACASCHNAPVAINHMKQMGGTFYGPRANAVTDAESCMMCHGPGTVAAIAAMHK
jgi:OmcA/MtrC family decaheme c-type cytochrome